MTRLSRRMLMLIAAAGSFALLLGAWGFQYIGGLAPCHLCLLQRYPHAVAAALGVLVLVGVTWRPVALLGALAAMTTAGIGVYHVGVEQKLWQGPTSCTGFDISQMSPDQLMNAINAAPLVRCDEIAWSMFGISMAGYNVILSVILALIWIAAWRKAD